MTSWDELQKVGIAEANSILAARTDTVKLRDLIVEWIRATRDVPRSTRAEISVHSATTALSDDLHAAGLGDVCHYVRSFVEEVGPIRPGHWLFATLLGRACAADLGSALAAGEWRDVPFWGHEQFGAWDAFVTEFLWILEHDEVAREGAWTIVAGMIAAATRDPGQFTFGTEQRASVRAHVEQYLAKPTIQEAWQTPLDTCVLFDRSFMFGIVRKLDAKRFLAEAEKLPHPVFFDPGLGDPEVADEREIARLLAVAPVGFEPDGVFRHAGMIVVRLLGEAAARIRHLAGSGRVYPLPPRPDDKERMKAVAETATAAADVVLDAVFLRPDATFLAWAWLERLIFEGEHRGFWCSAPGQGAGLTLDALLLLIAALARRLNLRDDAEAWVLGKEPLRRSDRVAAILAVAVFGRTPDGRVIESLLRSALMSIEPDYPAAHRAITRSDSLMGRIGGRCILAVAHPDAFVATLWQQLRPFRERAWHSVLQGEGKSNIGELLVLWGIFALDEACADMQSRLMHQIEAILRDAFQTDVHAAPGAFWPAALERFGTCFGKTCSRMSDEVDKRVADLLRPYLRADDYFFRLVVCLSISGLEPVTLHRVLASFELNLPDLVEEFLATRQQLIARGDYDRPWLEKVRSLSSGGEQRTVEE
jgi:hypothetical protein